MVPNAYERKTHYVRWLKTSIAKWKCYRSLAAFSTPFNQCTWCWCCFSLVCCACIWCRSYYYYCFTRFDFKSYRKRETERERNTLHVLHCNKWNRVSRSSKIFKIEFVTHFLWNDAKNWMKLLILNCGPCDQYTEI